MKTRLMIGTCAMLLWAGMARAATITVNTTADNTTAGDGHCTLREAIANVNAAADTTGGDCTAASATGDTIKFGFGMPATITLALGELKIQRDLVIANPAPGSLRLDAAGKSRIFEIAAGTTSLSGLTIQHGLADNGGGVLVNHGATLTLVHCALLRNKVSGPDSYSYDGDNGGGIYNAGTLHLTDCTLARNTASTIDGRNYGGAIHNAGGTATLTNCTLTKNIAGVPFKVVYQYYFQEHPDGQGYGGGISNLGGVLTLDGCSLAGNRATGIYPSYGGGIYNSRDRDNYDVNGTATLTHCTFSRNLAHSGGDSYTAGGGIYSDGFMTVAGCTFSRNGTLVADLGESVGAGINNDGVLVVSDSTFTRNVALNPGPLGGFTSGGGISNGNDPDGYGPANLTVTNCTFSRNATWLFHSGESDGGAIDNGGTLTMTNSTLVGNSAKAGTSYGNNASGGGVFSSGDTSITNCTLSGNRAHRAGPYTYQGGGGINGDTFTLTNTIIANSGVGMNCAGDPPTSAGHNLSSDNTCFSNGGSDLLNTQPQLAALGNYGGPTQTMALCTGTGNPLSCRAASPAIDAGDDTVTGPPDTLTTDQRGLPRKAGLHVDIGADEAR